MLFADEELSFKNPGLHLNSPCLDLCSIKLVLTPRDREDPEQSITRLSAWVREQREQLFSDEQPRGAFFHLGLGKNKDTQEI